MIVQIVFAYVCGALYGISTWIEVILIMKCAIYTRTREICSHNINLIVWYSYCLVRWFPVEMQWCPFGPYDMHSKCVWLLVCLFMYASIHSFISLLWINNKVIMQKSISNLKPVEEKHINDSGDVLSQNQLQKSNTQFINMCVWCLHQNQYRRD